MYTLDDNHCLSKSRPKPPPARITRYQSRASVHPTCTALLSSLRDPYCYVTDVNMFIRAVDNPYPPTPLSFSPPRSPAPSSPPPPLPEFNFAFSKLTY